MRVIKHNQKTPADIPLHWSWSWTRRIPRSWMTGRLAEMVWGGRWWCWETFSDQSSDLQTLTASPCWPPVTWTASHWRRIPVLAEYLNEENCLKSQLTLKGTLVLCGLLWLWHSQTFPQVFTLWNAGECITWMGGWEILAQKINALMWWQVWDLLYYSPLPTTLLQATHLH